MEEDHRLHIPSPAGVKCWEHFVPLIPSYITLLSPTIPTSFGDASADFSYCSWVSHYCTQQTQSQSLALGFLPVLHPGLWPGSSEMLPSSLLCAACFPIFSSPKHSFPNPYSAIHTSPFSFYILQPTFTVSLPLNFLSLLFPVKLAITSSFLSLSLFLVAWRWTPPSTPVYF